MARSELDGGYFKTKVKVTAAGRLLTQFWVAGPALGLGHQKLEEPASWVPFYDGAQHTEDFCLFNSTASSPSPCRWELMRFKERLLQFLQREPGVGHDRCPYMAAHCIWLSL